MNMKQDQNQRTTIRSYASARLMSWCALGVVLAFSVVSVTSLNNDANDRREDLAQIEWWKKTNFYHIYLRSFQDSTGDGNGDLRGVIQRLDYLQQIGVETILMAPFYSSPMKDCGYDIDNYVEINPMFGTMADFDDLMRELKRRNMRMVVDFVPNHSSNKHHWFECSERALVEPERCGRYKDYYVWTDSRRYENKLPSNWISVFGGGPAWTWSEVRKQFYLHQFLPEQPDLNFTNPLVREEFKEIARFWLRRGADGLRVDSAIYLVENTNNGEFPDEPPSVTWKPGDDPADRLEHMHTRCLHESAEIVRDWRDVASEQEFAGQQKVIITEAYDRIPKLIEYYGTSPSDKYADLPFNFELLKLTANDMHDARLIETAVMNWIQPTRALAWPNERGAMAPWIIWVTGNHDNKRLANKIGTHRVTLFKWLTYFMPGVPVNYYGDELPIHDANFNTIPQRTIAEGEPTRLPFRVPMAWTSAQPSGDFSTSSAIWMPLNEDFGTQNVAHLLSSDAPVKNELKQFVRLQELRRAHLSTFVFGDLVFFNNKPATSVRKVLAIARMDTRTNTGLLLLANLDDDNELVVRLDAAEKSAIFNVQNISPPKRGEILLTSAIDTRRAPLVVDGAQQVPLDGLVLARSQAIVVKF